MIEVFEYAPNRQCPYCEGEARIQRYQRGIKFKCPDCDHTTPEVITEKDFSKETIHQIKVEK